MTVDMVGYHALLLSVLCLWAAYWWMMWDYRQQRKRVDQCNKDMLELSKQVGAVIGLVKEVVHEESPHDAEDARFTPVEERSPGSTPVDCRKEGRQ